MIDDMSIDIRVPHWADEANRGFDEAWHRAINAYSAPFAANAEASADHDGKHFMYEAKCAAHEVQRLALLFYLERQGKLREVHHQCSHDTQGTAVPDNHLTCCLGVECRKCPHLAAIDAVLTRQTYDRDGAGKLVAHEEPIADEQRDLLKAWTCVTHILMRGGDTANEGYILTTDDRMYWNNLYASLSAGDPNA